MSRILITGGAVIGAALSQHLNDNGYDIYENLSGNNLFEHGVMNAGLINRIQHETGRLNVEKNSQSFIQQKMQGKRRIY